MIIAQTIISLSHANIDKAYDYAVKDGVKVQKGARVVVPFGVGNIKVCGYVIGLKDGTDVSLDKLKYIISVIDDSPIISEHMLDVALWMKEKYYATYAKCIQSILPAGMKSKKTMSKTTRFAAVSDGIDNESALNMLENYMQKPALVNQARVLDFLLANGKTRVSEIKEFLFLSDSPINSLKNKGIIEISNDEVKRDLDINVDSFSDYKEVVLNNEQLLAFDGIIKMMDSGTFGAALIHGITGSGKTEIYLRVIDEAINRGKQAIMLVPEISLTPQTIARFTLRFGDKVTVTHSKMSLSERYEQWKKALDGDINVIVGPRSAVFAPFNNLGVVIIDEEHEHSYKSESPPKYDAKEVAEKRLTLVNGLLIMGTATPLVETYYKAQTGGVKLFSLLKRAKENPLPNISIVDMRDELLAGNRSIFSSKLKEELESCLNNGEQAILFLNRRGFASFVSCRSCGNVIKCENCNVSYTYHKSANKLMCHYCGASETMPASCPACSSQFIKQFGAGTQKIEKMVNELFPCAKTIRMDMDTVSQKSGHQHILSCFADKKADVLIGTQMIAKGHDFAGVTLVGIVAADLSLNSGDFRSAESTFQLMTQVAGRAGRAHLPGKVIAQTYNPSHYAVMHAKTQNYVAFYEEEIKYRKLMNYPPFKSLFYVQLTGKDEKSVIVAAHGLLKIMNVYKVRGDYEILGPAPCTISKIKRQFRWRIIVKSSFEQKLTKFCTYCVDKLRQYKEVNNINIGLTLNPGKIE